MIQNKMQMIQEDEELTAHRYSTRSSIIRARSCVLLGIV